MAISRSDETEAWLEPQRAPLIGFVLPLVNGDLQAAEDVVQETMLRGWQHSTDAVAGEDSAAAFSGVRVERLASR